MNEKAEKQKRSPIKLPPKNLAEWLLDKSETVSREKALTARLVSDLMLAAGASGYGLAVYEPLVDRDGFDLIVDDADNSKSLQLKSRAPSGAEYWNIRKDLLRPSLEMRAEALGFTETVEGIGRGGGVIVQDIHNIDEISARLQIRYLYTDIYILRALADKLLPLPPDAIDTKQSAAQGVLTKLQRGIGKEKITLPLSVFVEASSVPALLVLMGIHSSSKAFGWQTHVVTILDRGPTTHFNEDFRNLNPQDKAQRVLHLRDYLIDQLRTLII